MYSGVILDSNSYENEAQSNYTAIKEYRIILMLEESINFIYSCFMRNIKFRHINKNSKNPLLLICDHAANYVPPVLKKLGLSNKQLEQHIGWDIGAANVTLEIAKKMDSRAILCGTSRLVIDMNRSPYDNDLIPMQSDGVIIPGNQNLSTEKREKRIKQYFWPYHNAIRDSIENLATIVALENRLPLVLSIHTFTPSMSTEKENARPWEIGVLWNHDTRISKPLIRYLRNHQSKHLVGNNKPYSGKQFYYTLDSHAGRHGIPHCAIEIRQDLVGDMEGINYWAEIVSDTLQRIMKLPRIFEIKNM